MRATSIINAVGPGWLGVLMLLATGCGTTQSQLATQQLLLSDAADRAVAKLDFRPLSGKKVYLDEKYVQIIKPQAAAGYVNADYILSSVRQQMLAANCLLEEKVDTAEYIVEIRIGTLGTDGHEVTYGLPPNNTLNSAVAAVPNAPNLPALPEISFAKRNDQLGAAKVAVFAYDRETRKPVWQSGTSLAMSNAKNVWVLGAGPFQSGTIYKTTRFAGTRVSLPLAGSKTREVEDQRVTDHGRARVYDRELMESEGLQTLGGDVQLSSFVEPGSATPEPGSAAAPAPGAAAPAPPPENSANPPAAGTPPAPVVPAAKS